MIPLLPLFATFTNRWIWRPTLIKSAGTGGWKHESIEFLPLSIISQPCLSTSIALAAGYPGNPRAQVGKVARVTDKDWLITLKGPLPDFQENDVIDNITWNPNITARNNHISVNPIRGFLLDTRGKIIAENNTFDRCKMPGILVEGDAVKWFESSPIRDLLIRCNRFIDCGIEITSTVREPKPEEPVHENIRIVNNTFENGHVSTKAVRGLVVMDNQSIHSPLKVEVVDPILFCFDHHIRLRCGHGHVLLRD